MLGQNVLELLNKLIWCRHNWAHVHYFPPSEMYPLGLGLAPRLGRYPIGLELGEDS